MQCLPISLQPLGDFAALVVSAFAVEKKLREGANYSVRLVDYPGPRNRRS